MPEKPQRVRRANKRKPCQWSTATRLITSREILADCPIDANLFGLDAVALVRLHLGKRLMQERAYEKRGEQCLLIKL